MTAAAGRDRGPYHWNQGGNRDGAVAAAAMSELAEGRRLARGKLVTAHLVKAGVTISMHAVLTGCVALVTFDEPKWAYRLMLISGVGGLHRRNRRRRVQQSGCINYIYIDYIYFFIHLSIHFLSVRLDTELKLRATKSNKVCILFFWSPPQVTVSIQKRVI